MEKLLAWLTGSQLKMQPRPSWHSIRDNTDALTFLIADDRSLEVSFAHTSNPYPRSMF
jgi:hypothetical protein